jgi:elongation factor P hydroxylase
MHCANDLIKIFNTCFEQEFQTQLAHSEDEPIYLPKSIQQEYHLILFAHGFFSSALHEISHWLIAGPKRRLLEDYGYWYEPDGRNVQQQQLFEKVEVKPQALEWIMSHACGFRFQFSLDNLTGEVGDSSHFKQAVLQQVKEYCQTGLSQRSKSFRDALCAFYGSKSLLEPADFFLFQ